MKMLRFAAGLWGAILAALAHGAEIEIPLEPMPRDTPEAKLLLVMLDAGDMAGALKDALKLTKRNPEFAGGWLFVAANQAERGELAEAIATLEQGLRHKKSDLPLLVMLAKIHEDRAQLGPGGARIGGMVRFTATPKGVDGQAFKSTEYRKAAARLDQAITYQPRVGIYHAKRVALLLTAGDTDEADKAAQAAVREITTDPLLWLQAAKAAAQLKRWSDASTAAERSLALKAGEPEAYQILAEVAGAGGDAKAKLAYERQARFYAFVPAFLTLPFTDAAVAIVDALSRPAESEVQDKEAHTAWVSQARAVIDGLLAEKTTESSRMLGVIAWHHDWHGEVEDGIYQELAQRKDEAVLMALFAHARSFCTVGGCAPALARLQSDAAFPMILERLPSDRNTFGMSLPEALALYQRPEAVPVLGKTLRDLLGEKASSADDPGAFMAGIGRRMLIDRCIWALGTFKGPVARNYLEEAGRKKEWASVATAALFLQSREPKLFEKLLKLLKKEPCDAERIAHHFKKAGLPQTAEVEALIPPEKAGRRK